MSSIPQDHPPGDLPDEPLALESTPNPPLLAEIQEAAQSYFDASEAFNKVRPIFSWFEVEVTHELAYARNNHPALHSTHEAFAVILEEVEEFKAEVWKHGSQRDLKAMLQELVQIAAMARRAAEDLHLFTYHSAAFTASRDAFGQARDALNASEIYLLHLLCSDEVRHE